MVRRRAEIEELAARLRALPSADQADLVRSVMTPGLRLQLAAERLWKRTGRTDARTVARAVHAAHREARRERERTGA